MMVNIRAGSEVVILAEVTDMILDPPALFSPNLGVRVTLHPPSGASPVIDQPMTEVSTGRYCYQYQTTDGSPVGVWTSHFRALHNSTVSITPKAGSFLLVTEAVVV